MPTTTSQVQNSPAGAASLVQNSKSIVQSSPAGAAGLVPQIQYVRLYQKDKFQDDSAVYLQWTHNEDSITSLNNMLQYIFTHTSSDDIDLGDESYTLSINTDKKYSLDMIKGCEICSGIFSFPDEFSNIDYKTLIDEWDIGSIITEFSTFSISQHFS
jgi:hypothetical protein